MPMPFHQFYQIKGIATGNAKFGSGKPQVNRLSYILLAIGLLFFVSGFFADRLTILPVLGVIFCLFWAILYARANRVCLNLYRLEILSQWKNEQTSKTAKASLWKVIRYTFFCLLPVYLMWTIPAFMCAAGGLVGWLSVGAAFWVVSSLVFWSFSEVWKDLTLKRIFFWGMHAIVWVIINFCGWLLFFLNVGVR